MRKASAFAALLFLLGVLALGQQPRAQLTATGVGGGGFGGVGSTYVGPGDVVGGAQAWYGFRAYKQTYAIALGKIANVCTPSDAICGDVLSDINGNFNLAGSTVSSCNNSTTICTVKTLYDQTLSGLCGGVCDITNTTIATRPILVVGTCTGSKSCLVLNVGGFAGLQNATGLTLAQPFTFSAVSRENIVYAGMYIFFSSGPALTLNFIGSSNTIQFQAPTSLTTTVADAVFHSIMAKAVSSSGSIYVNGILGVSGTVGANGLSSAMNIPLGSSAAPNFNMSEFGIWPSDINANAAALHSNECTYWGYTC